MAPSPSTDGLAFTDEDRAAMLRIAARSIRSGLEGHGALEPDLEALPPALREPCGAFVTVRVGGDLNGCIGTMERDASVASTVARMAWEAAFDDPRLPALRETQLADTHLEISVLSDLVPIPAGTREELLANLHPGEDGLVLEAGFARATFLPAVWASIPDARDFVARLMLKAGLHPDRWPADARAFRYRALEFSADFTAAASP